MRTKRQEATAPRSFSAAVEKTAEAHWKAQQKVNKAISQANRRKHRADQKTGALVMGIPDEIRGRVLAVVDAIVEDEKKLEACERALKSSGWSVVDTSVTDEAAE